MFLTLSLSVGESGVGGREGNEASDEGAQPGVEGGEKSGS